VGDLPHLYQHLSVSSVSVRGTPLKLIGHSPDAYVSGHFSVDAYAPGPDRQVVGRCRRTYIAKCKAELVAQCTGSAVSLTAVDIAGERLFSHELDTSVDDGKTVAVQAPAT